LSKTLNLIIIKPKLKKKFQNLKNSKWLPENYKALRKVLEKIERLNIFVKTLREREDNKPKLL
jgi:hypothetical protein